MNKLSKEKRDKLILIGMGTAGIVAALYFLVIGTQKIALAEYAEKTDAAKEKLAKAERWLRMAPSVEARLTAHRKELDSRQDSMAPVDKFKWFYGTLDKFLAERQIKLTDITRDPEITDVGILPKFPYQAAVFGVKLNARFYDLGVFLADFENQFPYMRVKNLQIEPEIAARAAARDLAGLDPRLSQAENLTVNMRVVTLIKPNTPL